MDKKKAKAMKPKVSPPSPKIRPKGLVDGEGLKLIEFDGKTEKVVPEDTPRKPGKTYFYRRVK